jgi:cysteinyl-tRNA synthetase
MDLSSHELGQEVEVLIEKREKAGKDKNGELTARLREMLKEMEIEIIDTREGPAYRELKW